jgi:hypothetical protein
VSQAPPIYKRKYEPQFPTVTIEDSAPGRIMTPAQIESLGFLAPAEQVAVLASASPARVSRRSEAAIRARKKMAGLCPLPAKRSSKSR